MTAFVTGWGCSTEAECSKTNNASTSGRPTQLKVTPMPIIDNDLAMCW